MNLDWIGRLTLLGSITEGLVEMVSGLREARCVYFLLGFCVDEDDSHCPVAEGKACDTTICAWSGEIVSYPIAQGHYVPAIEPLVLYSHRLLLRYDLDRSFDL